MKILTSFLPRTTVHKVTHCAFQATRLIDKNYNGTWLMIVHIVNAQLL